MAKKVTTEELEAEIARLKSELPQVVSVRDKIRRVIDVITFSKQKGDYSCKLLGVFFIALTAFTLIYNFCHFPFIIACITLAYGCILGLVTGAQWLDEVNEYWFEDEDIGGPLIGIPVVASFISAFIIFLLKHS